MRQWLNIFLLVGCCVSGGSMAASGHQMRQIDPQAIEVYKGDPDFDYTGDYAPPGSFFGMLLAVIFSKLQGLFHVLQMQGIWPWLLKLLIIAGIILIIFLLLRLKFGPALSRNSEKYKDLPVTIFGNDVEDYDKLLLESMNNRQYKLAIRYLFLGALGSLERQRKIEVTKWKAPYDYLKEVPEEAKSTFKALTDLFESTWYGDYVPDNASVRHGIQLYQSLSGLSDDQISKIAAEAYREDL